LRRIWGDGDFVKRKESLPQGLAMGPNTGEWIYRASAVPGEANTVSEVEGRVFATLHLGPAPESALGLRPRRALSSAQVSRSVSKRLNVLPRRSGKKLKKPLTVSSAFIYGAGNSARSRLSAGLYGGRLEIRAA